MNGLGNKFSAAQEISDRERIMDDYDARIKVLGFPPGTHTLGKEFESHEKKEDKK